MGSLVGADKDLQVQVADVSKVWVLADVPESQYTEIRRESAATITVPALGGKTFTGKVTLIAPALDAATRTVQVRIDAANPDGTLRPGMIATAEIQKPAGAEAKPLLALPSDAVMLIDGEPCAFLPVNGTPGKFHKQKIEAGETVGGWTPVLSGLKEGDLVVTNGAAILKAQLAKPAEQD
jgi:RND family efflux transporter MFP subunit